MAISFNQIEERLKTEAKKLLEEGKVTLVLAYGKGYDEHHPMPYVARCASDVENIVFNQLMASSLMWLMADHCDLENYCAAFEKVMQAYHR